MAHPRRRYLLDLLRRIGPFLLVFLGVYVTAGVLFYLFDAGRYSLFDSFYWSIVTLGTVGYGDIVPTTVPAKLLASGVIATQIFLLGYLITLITTAVNEEASRRALGTYGTDLSGHIVVLGYSSVGRSAVRELLLQEQKVAVVTETLEEVPNIRALADDKVLFVTFGHPAEREILERVNVPRAHGVIVCTQDDATNMIGALNVRSMAPAARVVVSVSRPELRDTLRAAGVTYVSSPSDMGGRLCASAAFEPDVASAIDDITAAEFRGDMQEYLLDNTTPISRQTFAEAQAIVRKASGCILIGYARADRENEYQTRIAPPETDVLAPGDAIIIVGPVASARKFRQFFGIDQGR